jgi:hypothetical protein
MCVAIIPATIANLLVLVTLLVTFMIWPFYTPETHYAPNVGPGSADAALYSVIREVLQFDIINALYSRCSPKHKPAVVRGDHRWHKAACE